MGPKSEELLIVLEDVGQLSRRHGEMHWAAWMARSAHDLRSGGFSGIRHLQETCGGMGSFNDLVLHPENALGITEAEVHAANERLDHMRGLAWRLADEIEREAAVE